MPDISMCTGEGCPLKNKCFRHKAVENEYRQSYFMVVPYKDGQCDEFWEIIDKCNYLIRNDM